jgi:hypothetical protein
MPVIARVVKGVAERQFAIYYEGTLVANVSEVAGLDEAIAATEDAGFDPSVYVPGLHISGLTTAAASQWFTAWRSVAERRDLTIRDHGRDRSVLVTGAFIGAWNDGSWYDLVIDTALLTRSLDS